VELLLAAVAVTLVILLKEGHLLAVVAVVLQAAAETEAQDRHLATQDLVLVVVQLALEMVVVALLLFDILVIKLLVAVL
jgi:hypothetical protein